MSTSGTGEVMAVCVVHELRPDEGNASGQTAIDKRPVVGSVTVGELGVDGDQQCDVDHHGGPDQAVYAVAQEEVQPWEQELGRSIEPGGFGENLRLHGVDVSGAVLGEHWQLGEPGHGPVLEVSMARIPCGTFARWMAEPQWVKRFAQAGAPGAYLRVREPGVVQAGDKVTVVHTPEHGVSVRDAFLTPEPTAMRALLAADGDDGYVVPAKLRATAERVVARD